MSLVKRGNSKFWYVQFQINHHTVIRSTRTTDRKAAEKIATKIRAQAHSEILLGRKKPSTVEAALTRFVESKAGTANHRNLVSNKNTALRIINGSMPLNAIGPSVLEEYKRIRMAEGCLPQTIKHGLNCIVGAMRLAQKQGYDCPDIQTPSIKIANKMVRYLSIDEERRLLEQLDPKREANGLPPLAIRNSERQRWMQDNYDLVVMLLDTGARYSEIANIQWKQIDLETRSIQLWRPKVANESIIFMTDRVAAIITKRSLTRNSDYLFSNKSGGPRGYSVIAIRKAMRRAGLNDCTVHTLRHTHATRLIQNGLSVYEVRAVLGHSDIRTTMRYAHLEQAKVTSKARDVINRVNRSVACEKEPTSTGL